jgi:hypothetical protein
MVQNKLVQSGTGRRQSYLKELAICTKGNVVGKVGEIGDLTPIDPHKTETMMEEEWLDGWKNVLIDVPILLRILQVPASIFHLHVTHSSAILSTPPLPYKHFYMSFS